MTGVALLINASAGAPSYSARMFRNGMAAAKAFDGVPLAGRQGIRPMGGTAANIVTLSGSTITVNLHAGEVTPGWSAVTGTYDVALTSVETHTLTAAHATQPRKDIVVGRVYDDDENTSGLRLYRSEYIAGVAGPSPSEPAVPTGAMRLATIDVPQSGGGSPVVTNNYTYTAAAGGVLAVRSQAERDAISNPYDGYPVYRVDRDWVEIYDGTVWRVQGVAHGSSTADLAAVTSPREGQLGVLTSGLLYRYQDGAWRANTTELYYQGTEVGNGTLAPGGNGATIMSVAIPDPGWTYYIVASASCGWAMSAATQPGNLIEGSITIDSTVYNTNRLRAGYSVSHSLGAAFTQPTLVVPMRRSDSFGAFSGGKTIRLMVRNSGAVNMTIPAGAADTSLSVWVHPA